MKTEAKRREKRGKWRSGHTFGEEEDRSASQSAPGVARGDIFATFGGLWEHFGRTLGAKGVHLGSILGDFLVKNMKKQLFLGSFSGARFLRGFFIGFS